jgi:ribonuclease-3
LGSGELKSGGYRRDSILSDALEAIMGAIVKDQGENVCKQWILSLFADKIENLSLHNWQKDPKTQLQEMMQSQQQSLPDYTLISTSGLTHEQTFKVECKVALIAKPGIGYGASRKKAEQAAAEEMLSKLTKEKA